MYSEDVTTCQRNVYSYVEKKKIHIVALILYYVIDNDTRKNSMIKINK